MGNRNDCESDDNLLGRYIIDVLEAKHYPGSNKWIYNKKGGGTQNKLPFKQVGKYSIPKKIVDNINSYHKKEFKDWKETPGCI